MAGKFVKDVLIQRLEIPHVEADPETDSYVFVNVKIRIRYIAFYDPGVRTFPNGDPGYPPSSEIAEYEVQVLEGKWENGEEIECTEKVIIADWLEDGNLPDEVYEQCMSVVSEMDEEPEATPDQKEFFEEVFPDDEEIIAIPDEDLDAILPEGWEWKEEEKKPESGEGNLPDQDYPW